MGFSPQEAIACHLWDESRHGDLAVILRLLDFGITLQDIGFSPMIQISSPPEGM